MKKTYAFHTMIFSKFHTYEQIILISYYDSYPLISSRAAPSAHNIAQLAWRLAALLLAGVTEPTGAHPPTL